MPADRPPLLLDTTVVSWLGSRKGPHAAWEEVVRGRQLFISFVTVGEILGLGLKAGWGARSNAEWEDRLRAYTVVPGTITIARAFAPIRIRFRKQLDDDDLWIAATAIATGLPLATGDSDFERVADAFPLDLVRPG